MKPPVYIVIIHKRHIESAGFAMRADCFPKHCLTVIEMNRKFSGRHKAFAGIKQALTDWKVNGSINSNETLVFLCITANKLSNSRLIIIYPDFPKSEKVLLSDR
jgi:hypothetical protein